MMKELLFAIFIFISFTVTADEKYCKNYTAATWEDMKESEFSKEKLEKRIIDIEKALKGELTVSEEFNIQSEIIIKGGSLRNSIELTKGSKYKASHKYYIKQFCDFLKNEARIIH